MNIFFNSKQEVIFLDEVEHLLVHNSSDMILVSLTCVSILLVLLTNGSLIYFILRQDIRTTNVKLSFIFDIHLNFTRPSSDLPLTLTRPSLNLDFKFNLKFT